MRQARERFSPHQLRQIAAEACVDPRTVVAVVDTIAGVDGVTKPRSTTEARVRKALRDLGFTEPAADSPKVA